MFLAPHAGNGPIVEELRRSCQGEALRLVEFQRRLLELMMFCEVLVEPASLQLQEKGTHASPRVTIELRRGEARSYGYGIAGNVVFLALHCDDAFRRALK